MSEITKPQDDNEVGLYRVGYLNDGNSYEAAAMLLSEMIDQPTEEEQ